MRTELLSKALCVRPKDQQSPPDVVTEDRFRQLVSSGWRIEVMCLGAAHKRHANYFGQWSIRAVSPEGGTVRRLVTARNLAEMRSFRTINGLVSFLEELGVATPRIPLREGALTDQHRQGG